MRPVVYQNPYALARMGRFLRMCSAGGNDVKSITVVTVAMSMLPAAWAGSIWGSPFALAIDGVVPVIECNTGNLPGSASCTTGTISGPGFTASSSSYAALAGGDLTVNSSLVSNQGVIVYGMAEIFDSLYFQGGNSGQFGQITMTSTGTVTGDGINNWASAGMIVNYGDLFTGLFQVAQAVTTKNPHATQCDAGALGAQICYSSDGQNLTLTATFPLSPDGVAVAFTLNSFVSVPGALSYTDPITITLPPGVTYTSESGTFLTSTSAVPEPSSMPIFAMGILTLLGRRLCGRK